MTPIGSMLYVTIALVSLLPSCALDTMVAGGAADNGAGADDADATADAYAPRRPTCIALAPDVYRTHYQYCADWAPGFTTAAFCDGAPPPESCWAVDSHQDYDGMYCCCDPSDGACDARAVYGIYR